MGFFSKYIGIGSGRSTELDNRTAYSSASEREKTVGRNDKKIRREVTVNDVKRWITADTEQEYAEKLLSLTGAQIQNCDCTFEQYADQWFHVIAEPNISTVTADTYERQLRLHINPVIGNKNLGGITVIDVQEIFNRMGESVKQDTKNKVRIVLNQIFKMAVENDFMRKNPLDSTTLKIKGLAATETQPYSISEMKYMVSHLDMIPSPTDKAWLALCVSLPLRPEEVLGLKWENVDAGSKILYVRNTVTHPKRSFPEIKSYTKTESSRRDLAIPQKILDLLPPRGPNDHFVIGGQHPLSYTQVRMMRHRIEKAIRFEAGITPRRFRTTVATDISSMTHDLKLVQKMLGHSTPQMTLKHYDKGRNTSVDATNAIEECYGL
jgi:integrase